MGRVYIANKSAHEFNYFHHSWHDWDVGSWGFTNPFYFHVSESICTNTFFVGRINKSNNFFNQQRGQRQVYVPFPGSAKKKEDGIDFREALVIDLGEILLFSYRPTVLLNNEKGRGGRFFSFYANFFSDRLYHLKSLRINEVVQLERVALHLI